MPDPEEIEAVRSILRDLAEVTSAELVGMWDGLGSWNRRDIPRLTDTARPLITASSRTAVQAQQALVPDLAVDPDGMARAMVELVEQPFHASWHALAEHRPWDEAIDVGRSATEAVGRDIPYKSARQTMTLAGNGRFIRSTSGTACKWCQQFIGVEFTSADAATFGHERCDCIVVPA